MAEATRLPTSCELNRLARETGEKSDTEESEVGLQVQMLQKARREKQACWKQVTRIFLHAVESTTSVQQLSELALGRRETREQRGEGVWRGARKVAEKNAKVARTRSGVTGQGFINSDVQTVIWTMGKSSQTRC